MLAGRSARILSQAAPISPACTRVVVVADLLRSSMMSSRMSIWRARAVASTVGAARPLRASSGLKSAVADSAAVTPVRRSSWAS